MTGAMQMRWGAKAWLVMGAAALFVGGCDSGEPLPGEDVNGPAETGGAMTCEGGGRGEAPACAGGVLVDGEGRSVEGVRVSACTPSTCITGTSDASGRFSIQGLPVEPHKFEVLAFIQGYYTTIYYSDMRAGVLSRPSRPIQLHPLPSALVTGFDPPEGGQLVLAGGDIVLDAEPAALSFPIGLAAEGAEALRVDPATLPDFDRTPWAGREDASVAFIFHPFPLRSDGGVEIALRAPSDRAEAEAYRLYSVHTSSAVVEDMGALIRGEDGLWRPEDPSRVRHLSVLVMTPEAGQ